MRSALWPPAGWIHLYAAEQLDYYVKTLYTRKKLDPVRTALQRENIALSGSEVEALVFAEATADFEAWPQWRGLLTTQALNAADYDYATQLIDLKARRILDLMAPVMSAERLRALQRSLQRRARHQALEVAQAQTDRWAFHTFSP